MNASDNLKSSIWISDPTVDELKTVRSIVNIPSIISAWIHTGDEMQLEACQYRLVLEIDPTSSGSAFITQEVKQRALREGLTVNVWCFPFGKVEQYSWLIDKSVQVV
jgi:hypothetical protein